VKTRINSRLKNQKGLTLPQTLIVIAIVVILLGVAFIGVQSLVNRMKQTKLDNIAQSMYVSAQNRIWELKASGEIDSLLTHTELTAVANQPADWGEVDPEDAVEYSDLKYFYHNKDNSMTSTSSDLVDFIFPQGSISGDVLDDNWVIELDPTTGYVYAAFYSETRSAKDFYIDNTDTLDQSGTSSIRLKDFRHSLKGNDKIGYYGGKADMPADASGYIIQAALNIINADVLQAKMTAIVPSVFDTSVLEFKLTVKGKTSKNTVTLTPAVSSKDIVTAKEFSASVILDKLADGQNFKATFGSEVWQPNYVEPRTGALIPGEDLELSFTVSSSDDSVLDIDPIERTANSLFESLNPTKPEEANIAYGRHLQNLDNSISGLPAGAITAAKQISDIDFNDESDEDLPAEEQFLWKTLYKDKTFTPINNPNLNKYSGYIDAPPATDSFKILNMHIADSNKPAGLFGTFTGDEISGLTMVNTKIDGGTDVGGLAGTTNSSLTIKDCRLYAERDYFETGTYENNILLKGTANVGGLVGSSTAASITIKDSFAATIIEGMGSIGGLIGKASGNAQIQNSYADSYLIGSASTSKIGGLAGELADGSSISGSYSAGFAIIKSDVTEETIVAAAGFVPSDISSVTNSYSIFNCFESKATTVYSTVPSATTVEKVYFFGPEDNKLTDSDVYAFLSNTDAANELGGKFSRDDNEYDSYPYNQKADLEPKPLVTYPYVSIKGLPHYGDWKIPPIPEIPEEELKFGKVGLFYWENVTGGSAPGYKIYLVSSRKDEDEKYEAVYHDTTSTTHNDRGIVKEYGYGYYVAKQGDGTEYELRINNWADVNRRHTTTGRNTSAEASFNGNAQYEGYNFYCYTTCDETNPATSYTANTNKYMFMTRNVQNATVTLKPEGEGEAELNYTFCPFFAKSIKLTGWNKLKWNYTGTRPALQNDPGTVENQYRIRSLDQLQFINWNNLSRTNDRMINYDRASTSGRPYYYKNFPYLHTTEKAIYINFGSILGWNYYNPLTLSVDGEEGWADFQQSRDRQNFIQDFDIECKRRTDYCPIAALGDTTGHQLDSFKLPLFAWFGGSFDGQSYKIKNLSITSSCHSVGVFGVTVSSTIKNIVLIGDSKDNAPVIKRPAGSPRGFYAIGTLVGIANEYSKGVHSPSSIIYPNYSDIDYDGIIKNCAVAGYEIIDESSEPVTCGETAIGGLAGILRTKIDRCSAVTIIKLKTKNDRGSVPHSKGVPGYGDYISVGGIAGRNQTLINNCYSGGRVIVDSSLIDTNAKIYISGIAASAVTPRFVNTSNIDARLFRKPQYNNCYSYMELPEPASNIIVGTIASSANFMFTNYPEIYYIGGEINNCYYYDSYYKPGQELAPKEEYLGIEYWAGQSSEKTYDDMSQEQFCTDLNDSASPAPYRKVKPGNYSFPCGVTSLEGKDYPFPAVITQEYSGEYVHYGEWPIERRLELTKSAMTLDLISYHEDENNTIIDDFYDETEVKFYYDGSYQDIVLSKFEIKKGDDWISLVDNQPVIINDKVSIAASVSETDGICKLTVTGIDKTDETEIIPLRYSVNDGYYSEALLHVDVTAVVNLSANPSTATTVKPGEIVKWNLILKDNNGNLIDSDGITTTSENWDFKSTSNNPSDPSTPEAVVFSLSITKAAATPDPSPFYLEATAQNTGEANFEVQALNIKVRDETNKDSEGNIRAFGSEKVDLQALCYYPAKLILKHHVGDGTEAYTDNSYIYNNGDQGIDPELISTDTEKSFSTLVDDMVAKDSRFAGWYLKDESGNPQQLLNTEGQIVSDIDNLTQNGEFNVNPAKDIELYAMWKIPYNLKFVRIAHKDPIPLTTDTKKYLVIAKVPPESEPNPEYYCMTGDPPGLDKLITGTQVDLQQSQGDYYYITSPVSANTMLWDVTKIKNKQYFKLFNGDPETYIKSPQGGADADAVFCGVTYGIEKPQYNSEKHNLFFQGNRRILFDNGDKKFIINNSDDNTITSQDGGIWLFEYSLNPDPQEILHEFK
jgi:competence protein ComGC